MPASCVQTGIVPLTDYWKTLSRASDRLPENYFSSISCHLRERSSQVAFISCKLSSSDHEKMRDVSVCLSTLASPEWKCQALSNPRSPLSLTGMRFLMSLFQALGWWKGTSSEKIAVEGGETWTGARALVRLSSFCQTCVFLTPKLWVASLGSS